MSFNFAILTYVDLLWLPIMLFALHGKHKFYGAGFVLCGALMLRMQVELMDTIGFPNGILPIIENDVHIRALITYSVSYLLYLLLAVWSFGERAHIFMGFTLSHFFLTLLVSTVVMVL